MMRRWCQVNVSVYYGILLLGLMGCHQFGLGVVSGGQCEIAPVIFNFGDSNSDTGGLTAGLGYRVNPPNGRTFFRKPTGRLSDGRLVIDFLWLKGFVNEEGFRNALYLIDIGQNDLADSFSKNLSYTQVVKRIPLVIAEIKDAIKALYDEGGRKFWVHNTGPLGCLPQKLWLVQHKKKDLDAAGCLSSYNSAARLFNTALLHLCQEMKAELLDATIVHVDIYSIKYDIISNANRYGFSSPLMACCGAGGPPYNYNIKMTCGNPGSQACNDGSRYVSWDGIHHTEAVNAIIAQRILSTDYSTPRMSFDFFCHK